VLRLLGSDYWEATTGKGWYGQWVVVVVCHTLMRLTLSCLLHRTPSATARQEDCPSTERMSFVDNTSPQRQQQRLCNITSVVRAT